MKFLIFLLLLVSTAANAQKNIAERLGYEKDAKLLIMHADDIGVAYSVNRATIRAFEESGISSASIMVPCPWFKDIVTYIEENPGFDYGLHLTFTAEWENYKWDGVLPSSEIPSLINEEGYFYASVQEVVENAKPEEVEKELRAQVQRAIDFGIDPTHLDSHMGTLFSHPEYFKSYQKVGKEYGIPVFVPIDRLGQSPQFADLLDPWVIPVDRLYSVETDVKPDDWADFYGEVLNNMPSGLNEIIIHLAYDDEEMQAITVNHPDFGSAWRQRDLDFVLSSDFKSLLKKNNIQLVTYRQIKELLNQEK